MQLRITVPERHVTADVLNPALETVTRLNERMIAEGGPTFTDGLRHGVRWHPEPFGQGFESFDHSHDVMARGNGDCDDLAPWACAEMRANGTDPNCKAIVKRSGPNTWHAVVQRSDGSIRDPSAEAGMHSVHGVAPAIVPMMPLMAGAIVGGHAARPMIAVRRIVTPRGNVGFDARCDIPMTDTDFALSTLQRRKVASQAIIGAVLGACYWSEAAGTGDPEHMARLYAIAGLCNGEDPDDLAEALGRSAVVGALPFCKAFAESDGHSVGFNFGKFLKVLEPLASTAVSFIPGAGPIISKAMDITTAVATKQITPEQAIQQGVQAVLPGGLDFKVTVQEGAHIALA